MLVWLDGMIAPATRAWGVREAEVAARGALVAADVEETAAPVAEEEEEEEEEAVLAPVILALPLGADGFMIIGV